jgi:hypothetical protein
VRRLWQPRFEQWAALELKEPASKAAAEQAAAEQTTIAQQEPEMMDDQQADRPAEGTAVPGVNGDRHPAAESEAPINNDRQADARNDTGAISTEQPGELQFHELAALFPLMEGADFERFKADIAANGLHEPILVRGNLIIDGRNRYRACRELGIEPATLEFQGDDKAVLKAIVA